MSANQAWPPLSSHAALLTSPSGRNKYQQNSILRSPLKQSATTPSLVDRLRAARSDNDIFEDKSDMQDQEDDEETLQLQLAAIEAKLKLKKLQQSKARLEGGRDTPALSSARPKSVAGTNSRIAGDAVHVGVSPTKKPILNLEPKSPNRVLLGIDKGLKASDVSLRRARSTNERSRAQQGSTLSSRGRPASRILASGSNRSTQAQSTPQPHIKSFSERISEAGNTDRAKDANRASSGLDRRSGFRINKAEVEAYRAQAEQHKPTSRSPTRTGTSVYSRDEILQAQQAASGDSHSLKTSRTAPDLRQSPTRPSSRSSVVENNGQAESSMYEGFSGIHLSSRILPQSFLKRTLPEDRYSIYSIKELLKDVKSPGYEMPDRVGEYVVFGIVASKSSPLDHKEVKGEDNSSGTRDWEQKWDNGSQNQKKFIAMTITDLNWSLDLYLFGTAVPRYHRLSPGTVLAILNPGIMPPKRGKEESGAFSLTLSDGDHTVLEIGSARHLGFCNAKRKDGKECGQWIDRSKTEICEWHLNLELYKTQGSRMGVNTGTNGFGGGGGKTPANRHNTFDSRARGSREGESGRTYHKPGERYDRFTGNSYYVSSSGGGAASRPQSQIGVSASRALDLDDPFIAEGQMSRDKKGLLQKRKEQHERENVIAKRLGQSSYRGAGAEYMRHKTGDDAASQRSAAHTASQRSALSAKDNIMRSKSDAAPSRKRAAESVRLSPIKKTRFVTDRGIREAGRESLGVTTAMDEDDLDIV